LKSLKGSPEFVGDFYYCFDNNLNSLEGLPKIIGGDFNCDVDYNNYLEEEFELRKENPDLSDGEIQKEMYRRTQDRNYLSKEANSLFM